MIFFTDRDLGRKKFPGILRDGGVRVETHFDHFPPAAPDTEWIPEVARRGWFILSNDKGIMRNPIEREAILTHNAGLFILVGGSMRADLLARNFVNTSTEVLRFIKEHPRPFIAKVYRPSPVELIEKGRTGRVVLKYPIDRRQAVHGD